MSDRASDCGTDISEIPQSTTTISTVAVQAGRSKVVLAILRVDDRCYLNYRPSQNTLTGIKTGSAYGKFREKSIYVPDFNASEGPLQLVMTTERENSTFYPEANTTDAPDARQRHCAHKCQLYLDEKFKSDCVSGRCVCHGENYQLNTCLPYVGRCKISKGFFPFVNFSMADISTPAYTCRPSPYSTGKQLHIVSLYGNHYAKSTIVKVKDESVEPVTLVLANYYPVSWKVIYQGTNIQSIILASQFNVDSSSVEIIPNNADGNHGSKPMIRTMQIPVGFGTDVHNSKTVEMLKILLERIGTVRSFAGADYADYISVRIDDNS